MKNLHDWFFGLLRKIGTERRYQVSFGITTAGLIMIIGSHLLDSHSEFHLIRTVLLEIGIACIIAAIAEFLLLKHAGDVFRDAVLQGIGKLEETVTTFQQEVRRDMKMFEQADETFRQEARQDMKILTHCLEHQLVDVMPPLNKDQEKLAFQEIQSAIENARGEIRVIAFTLRDILNGRMSLGGQLKQLLSCNENVEVKLLLVDPSSDAARIRAIAEEKSGTVFEKSNLLDALRENFFRIKGMIKEAEDKSAFQIEARFYNILPGFYMVSTPDEVFIEPYHLRPNIGNHSNGAGIVPLLRFRSRSPMYELAQAHFSYIWDSQKKGANGNSAPNRNGCIQIKTMDDVYREQEIERRLDNRERRGRATEVPSERRSSRERRDAAPVKVRSASF